MFIKLQGFSSQFFFLFIKIIYIYFHFNSHTHISHNTLEKDNRINQELEKNGYRVIRFWGSDVKKDANACVRKILEIMSRSN
ncbi:MAG: DUF559 domain-containing protein [Thaumarchaeota archaeon]|nr:MAG: DUF559 domain-containing protein [Nitrososphaerota archaeon]